MRYLTTTESKKTIDNNVWTQHLISTDNTTEDPYKGYKEDVSERLEELINDIAVELKLNDAQYDFETAYKMSINLLMEQLLKVQFKETPKSQEAMVINIFSHYLDSKGINLEKLMEKIAETKNKTTLSEKVEHALRKLRS